MKLINLALIVFTFGIISCDKDDKFTVDCLSTNLQNGIIAFYPFNSGSLTDESLNNNNLNNPTTAVPTTDRNGNSNCAFEFENSQTVEEFLTTTNSNFLNALNEFSISIWYEPIDTTRSGGSYEILLSRDDEGHCPDRRGEWTVGLYDCRRAVFGHNNSVWANSISNPFSCQGEVNTLSGKWHHVVAIKNNDEYKIYFNGNLNGMNTGNANCGSTLHLAEDLGDMFIGKYYTGKIDDVIIYNRELSQQEVTELFNLTSCCE